MKRWMRLSTYMKLVASMYNIPVNANQVFDFDKGSEWQRFVKASDIAIKAATIVTFDRWSMKDDQRRV